MGEALIDSTRREMSPEEFAEYWGFNCPTCEDSKWVAHHVPLRHPDFGKMFRCPDCQGVDDLELARRKLRYAMEAAGFYGRMAKALDTFDPARQRSLEGRTQAENAKRSVVQWANGGAPDFVLLSGGRGIGKTHLEEGAVRRVIERGDPAKYVMWEDFSHGVRDSFDKVHQYLDDLRDARYLVIDDVGTVQDPREFVNAKLQEIVGHRFASYKPTLIAGNIGGEADYWSTTFGERFASRMEDATRVKLINMWRCQDIRPTLGSAEGWRR